MKVFWILCFEINSKFKKVSFFNISANVYVYPKLSVRQYNALTTAETGNLGERKNAT